MDLLSLDPHVKVQQMHYALVVQSCPTLWDTDCSCQALLSMEFSSQEYWSGLPLLSPGDLPDPGIEPTSLNLLHGQAGDLPLAPPRKFSKRLAFLHILTCHQSIKRPLLPHHKMVRKHEWRTVPRKKISKYLHYKKIKFQKKSKTLTIRKKT